MATISETLLFFCEWLIGSTVRAGVLILVILAVQYLLHAKMLARWRCWFWVLLMVQMLMPWAPESRLSVFNLVRVPAPDSTVVASTVQDHFAEVPPTRPQEPAEAAEPAPPVALATIPEPTPEMSFKYPAVSPGWSTVEILSFVWLLGALLFGVFVIAENLFFWARIRREPPLTDPKTLELLGQCEALVGIRIAVVPVVTEAVKSPALFGLVRPRLLLPLNMLRTLAPRELRYVFLHELAHLKRRDIFVTWVTTVLQVLHWFNPLIWYAFYRMRADRELACDALVLSSARPGEPQEYGRALVHLLEQVHKVRRVRAMAGILEDKSQLKRRVTTIALFKKNSYRFSALAVGLLAVLGQFCRFP